MFLCIMSAFLSASKVSSQFKVLKNERWVAVKLVSVKIVFYFDSFGCKIKSKSNNNKLSTIVYKFKMIIQN